VRKKSKVFSRQGSFSANEKDPPIGEPIEILAQHFIEQPEPAAQTRPPVSLVNAADTDCHELNNIRVRVLKPDMAFIRDITERLNRLNSAVNKLNTNIKPED
jgi:hypothetical protein